jgi:uncharacterized repeat protein (TIGR03803 family)
LLEEKSVMDRAHTLSAFLALAVCSLVLLLGLAYAPSAYAQSKPSIKALFSFACDPNTKVCPDGEQPNTLFQSADGNFYGTTTTGGTGNKAAGTVFKITPGGPLTTIYTFVSDQNGNYPNGGTPHSLVEGNDGYLYGTAGGGANNTGLVFRLSKGGRMQALNSAVGAGPSVLVLGRDGNLYGGTFGNNAVGGTLFRVTPSGSYTLLHTFNRTVEGPMALGMTLASDGNLYGTTLGGEELLTTLFRLTPSGQFTILHSFHYAQFPVGAPVQASNGQLYAAMSRFEDEAKPGMFASSLSGAGFKQFSLPFAFGDAVPYMTQASDSNLWSILFGSDVNEEVISLSPNGKLLQTITFDGANGELPNAPLIQGSDGRLFGVTQGGGSVQQGEVASGVVFELDAGLAAPKPSLAGFNPSRGKAGTQVMIYGNRFVGTTAVTFNGVSTTFRVLNTGNILATVPQGATIGPIAVRNPGGTATSKRSFTVD